jgi:transcriptional regulator
MTESAKPADLVQGTVDVLILRTLAWQPMHGYAISRFIRERSRDELFLDGAALYQGLHRLERKRLIRSKWSVSETNRRVRVYDLTPAGHAQLAAETEEWRRYAAAVGRVLAPA